jgi:sugar (pentulose or hexulose) kinase
MSNPRYVAVIDIGKTNAKVALVDLETCTEIEIQKQPNHVFQNGPYPHYDVDGIWHFIQSSLDTFKTVDAISITTHGATAALVDSAGDLVLPILDYEHDVFSETYKTIRPKFWQTGSPLLPIGLNLGAQLHWLEQKFPVEFAKTHHIMMYPQYWVMRLTGTAVNEVTSLGCHTDLWCPSKNDYSSLVDQKDWRKLMPPLVKAETIAGHYNNIPVAVGIHDSNASLYGHLKSQTKPFAVVSTGTWVVAMAVGVNIPRLDEARDTLININALGEQVPSARFMGGREFEIMMQDQVFSPNPQDIETALGDGIFLLPAIVPECGPFPHQKSHWVGNPTPKQKQVALSFYLSLMTQTCLDLIGAKGKIIVEGPLASNPIYCDMLATATGQSVIASMGSQSGTTIGAALLISHTKTPTGCAKTYPPHKEKAWTAYAKEWRDLGNKPISV